MSHQLRPRGIAVLCVLVPAFAFGGILTGGGIPDKDYQVGGTEIMKIWVKADAINTNAGSGEVRVSGGTVYVTNWVDQSTWTNDATQSKQLSQPTYVANAVGGEPAVRFDGVTNYLNADGVAPSLDKYYTAFVVANQHTASARRGIFSAHDPGLVQGQRTHVLIDETTGDQYMYCQSAPGGVADSAAHGYHTTTNTWYNAVFGFDTDYEHHTYELNGATMCSEEDDDTDDVGSNNLTVFVLGAMIQYWTFYLFDGDIAEFILYEGVLSNQERDDVGYYLQQKYGIGGLYEGAAARSAGSITKSGQPNPHYMVSSNLAMRLWLKADTIDTNDTDQVRAGQFVKKWEDQSRSREDVTQSADASQPSYVADLLNSLPGVRFDGTAEFLSTTSNEIPLVLDEYFTAFVVARQDDSTVRRGIFSSYDEDLVQGQRLCYLIREDTDAMTVYHQSAPGGVGDHDAFGTGYATDTGNWYNALFAWDTGTAPDTMWFGLDGALTNDTETGDVQTNQLETFTIGSAVEYHAHKYFDGDITEFILYNRVLNSNEINSVGFYLQQKYDLTGTYSGGPFGTMVVVR